MKLKMGTEAAQWIQKDLMALLKLGVVKEMPTSQAAPLASCAMQVDTPKHAHPLEHSEGPEQEEPALKKPKQEDDSGEQQPETPP